MSQAILHLRIGGTLKDNLISEVQEIQRLSGCVHKTFGGEKNKAQKQADPHPTLFS